MSAVRKRNPVGVLAAAAALVIGLSSFPLPVAAGISAAFELKDTTHDPIPEANSENEHFKSWSLFLVCNPAWVLPQKEDQLNNLYWSFGAFGLAIGLEHAAVWFRISTANDKKSLAAHKIGRKKARLFGRALIHRVAQ